MSPPPPLPSSDSSPWLPALIGLLFGLPGLALVAALVPPWVLPQPQQRLFWAEWRVEVGAFAAAVLVVEALLFLLLA